MIQIVLTNCGCFLPLQVLLFKHLIVYLADGEDKDLKEFVKDFLNPDSTVSWKMFINFIQV